MLSAIFTIGFFHIFFLNNTEGDVYWALTLIRTFTLVTGDLLLRHPIIIIIIIVIITLIYYTFFFIYLCSVFFIVTC